MNASTSQDPGEPDPFPGFDRDELRRYARHFALPGVGPEGQRRIREAAVLVVGAGGLGSPAALYLAAAGVGRLGIVDDDRVELSNLQRQILHGTADVGRPKVESAGARLAATNPGVALELHRTRLSSGNAAELLARYDLVVDGSDNFPTRYLVNDAAVLRGIPWVYGAVLRWEGQLALFGAPDGPCYRCLFREPPPPGAVPGCAEAGVMGALTGVIGSLQALEALKWIVGAGTSAAGRLLRFDGLALSVREVHPRRDPGCPLCGDAPSIRELVDYEWFCETGETRARGEGAATADPLAPADDRSGSRGDVGTSRADGEGAPRATASGGALDPEALRRAMAADAPPLLLDVREAWEWAAGNLSHVGARHLPLADLEAGLEELKGRVGEMPGEGEVVLYCQTGVRSARALEHLHAAGVPRARHLAGGIEAWFRVMGEP